MRAVTAVIAAAILIGAAALTSAHERDVMTPQHVGPIVMNETTVAQMKDLFGEPRGRLVKRVGCSKVVRLRWGRLQTYHYRGPRTIVDVRVRSDHVPARAGAYRFHTRRDLRVGDSEARLQELYPKRKPLTHPHGGHIHYRLAGEYEKLMAKVVDGMVVELESAPYEYC